MQGRPLMVLFCVFCESFAPSASGCPKVRLSHPARQHFGVSWNALSGRDNSFSRCCSSAISAALLWRRCM